MVHRISANNVKGIESRQAGIIEGDSAGIIEGDFSRSAGIIEGDLCPRR